MTSPSAKQPQSWWRRNFNLPEPSPSPMHAPRPSACVCPCASCFNGPRPQSYFHPQQPDTSISSTSATLTPPYAVVSGERPVSLPGTNTPWWETKRSSVFSTRFLLRRRTSYDTLASDCVPLRAEGHASFSR